MSDFGIKMSPENKDVGTSPDKDLVFTSAMFGLKIYKTGTVNVTIPSGSADFSEHYTDVNHDLGYAPAFYAFVEDQNGDMIGLNVPFVSEMKESTSFIAVSAWSDSTKLRLILTVVSALGTDVTRSFKYYIFVEPTT